MDNVWRQPSLQASIIRICIRLLAVVCISCMAAGCCKSNGNSGVKTEPGQSVQIKTGQAAQSTGSVRGQVVDENSKPLAEVAWTISGTEELRDGKWTRVIRLGISPNRFTDAEGRFVVPFRSPMRYDLQFHKPSFAPAFVYEITADSAELKVTLKRGERIHGTVMRLVDGHRKPAVGKTVELCLPGCDLWYQERVSTDINGKFEFRACAPPSEPPLPAGNLIDDRRNQDSQPKRKWQLVCADKIVQIDVSDGKAVEAVDFTIDTEAKERTNTEK